MVEEFKACNTETIFNNSSHERNGIFTSYNEDIRLEGHTMSNHKEWQFSGNSIVWRKADNTENNGGILDDDISDCP